MPYPNIFDQEISARLIERINQLNPDSERQWGTMDPAQMLAHCCVSYESIYEPDKHPPPNFAMKFVLKNVLKGRIVGDTPFKRNSPTAPQFKIKDTRDFEREKARLIEYIERTQKLGEAEFDGRESPAFGALSKTEWSNLLYKHLDHHLEQFGV